VPTWFGYITRGLHLFVLSGVNSTRLNSYVMFELNGFKSLQKEIMELSGLVLMNILESTVLDLVYSLIGKHNLENK
jgi:hypothetical protein